MIVLLHLYGTIIISYMVSVIIAVSYYYIIFIASFFVTFQMSGLALLMLIAVFTLANGKYIHTDCV